MGPKVQVLPLRREQRGAGATPATGHEIVATGGDADLFRRHGLTTTEREFGYPDGMDRDYPASRRVLCVTSAGVRFASTRATEIMAATDCANAILGGAPRKKGMPHGGHEARTGDGPLEVTAAAHRDARSFQVRPVGRRADPAEAGDLGDAPKAVLG
jgi:hypothetical protein